MTCLKQLQRTLPSTREDLNTRITDATNPLLSSTEGSGSLCMQLIYFHFSGVTCSCSPTSWADQKLHCRICLYHFSWKAHCLAHSLFYFLMVRLEISRAQPKPCSSVVTWPRLGQLEEQLEEPRHCKFSSAGWSVHAFFGDTPRDPVQMFYHSQCLKTLQLTPAGDAVGDCQQDRQVRQVFQLVIIQS